MFKTIEEGLTVYKAELADCRKRSCELAEKWRSWTQSGEIPWGAMGDDLKDMAMRKVQIGAMEKALGLTQQESDQAHTDAGMPHGTPLPF